MVFREEDYRFEVLQKGRCIMINKNGVKTPICFAEPSAYCYSSYFLYESKLSTGSTPHISSGAYATQKNRLAINRDKPIVNDCF